jgi:hypothetical protein
MISNEARFELNKREIQSENLFIKLLFVIDLILIVLFVAA